jgi:adenylate cyclase
VDDDLESGQREELERRGLYDPLAPDGPDQLDLIRYVMSLGATIDDIAVSPNLGELALDLDLRPRSPSTMGQVLASLPLTEAAAGRLLTALGLGTEPDEPVTEDEAEAIRLFGTSVELLGVAGAVQLAGVAAAAMARVAETLVGEFRIQVELPRLSAGVPRVDVVKEYAGITRSLLPPFVRSLNALLRQQILAVARRMWSTDPDRSTVTVWRTVGFVDLVGYTETSGALSARQLAQVLLDFDERTAQAVRRGNGQVIKMIGDEAMFVTEEAGDACQIALDLVAPSSRRPIPPVRVGLATGELISVMGDLYGPGVNLAARLVALAEPNTVAVSQRTRDDTEQFDFEVLPVRALKGFPQPLPSFKLVARHGAP